MDKIDNLVLRNNDIVMIQSVHSKQWISYPKMQTASFGSQLIPVPSLSDNALEAMFFQVRDTSVPDKHILDHQSKCQILLMEHVVQNRPVLAVHPVTAQTLITIGAQVFFAPIGRKTTWLFRSSSGRTLENEPVRYGRPHYIQDYLVESVLTPHLNRLVLTRRKLGKENDPESPQLWTMYPVATISTCETITKQCRQTKEHENAYIGLQCTGNICINKFGENVFDNLKDCEQYCEETAISPNIRESAPKSSYVKSESGEQLQTRVPKPLSPLTILMYVTLFLVFLFTFLVLYNYGKLIKYKQYV